MNVLLIIAHHCILPGAFKGFEEVLDKLHHELPQTRVASTSLLDLENDLRTILREDAVESVLLLPYLLLNGQHTKNDVPKVVAKLKQEFPGVSMTTLPCLGDWSYFADMVVRGVKDASTLTAGKQELKSDVVEPQNKLFPIEINLEDKNVLVVGGGAIASRKIRSLLVTGAKIQVVAPQISDEVRKLYEQNSNQIELVCKPYEADCLRGVLFVFICTDQPAVNADVYNDAKARRIFVNNACHYKEGDFIVPARMDFGKNITVTVSTKGNEKSLAKKLKNKIKTEWGDSIKKMEKDFLN